MLPLAQSPDVGEEAEVNPQLDLRELQSCAERHRRWGNGSCRPSDTDFRKKHDGFVFRVIPVPLGGDFCCRGEEVIDEGHALVRECLAINRLGRDWITRRDQRRPHRHPTASDTDWSQVVALYDQVGRLDPSPIVALRGAVAAAGLDGPDSPSPWPTRCPSPAITPGTPPALT